MTYLTENEANLLLSAAELTASVTDWRLGQAFFNHLYHYNQKLADAMRGSKFDPFYEDELIDDAMAWLTGGAEAEETR